MGGGCLLLICYSTRDKTERWGLGNQGGREEKGYGKPAWHGLFLSRRCLLELGSGILQQVCGGWVRLGGDGL